MAEGVMAFSAAPPGLSVGERGDLASADLHARSARASLSPERKKRKAAPRVGEGRL
jgi:hypothetical protein